MIKLGSEVTQEEANLILNWFDVWLNETDSGDHTPADYLLALELANFTDDQPRKKRYLELYRGTSELKNG